MAKILVTGTTGYIGGDALSAIAEARPELVLTCLVRSSAKGALVAAQHPSVRLIYGDLDSHDLLAEEASKADVVVHTADCDHEGSARAIVEGISKRPEGGYLIHTSGAGLLCYEDDQKGVPGTVSDHVYNDWDGIGEVTSMPDDASHRNVDKIVLAAHRSSGGKVNTAIVCPPLIYGPGRGAGNRKSSQIESLTKGILTRGKGFMVGDGENVWSTVNVHDLSDLYVQLVEAALAKGGKATWNEAGYYFAENGEAEWGDIARKSTKEILKQGHIKTAELDQLSMSEADEQVPGYPGGRLWGLNSKSKAVRARELFGWQPKGESIEALLPSLVEQEARDLGLLKGHAAQAAGNA